MDGHSNPVASKAPRLAIIHEWLTDWGGSEAVTAAMLDALPDAKLHALFNFLSPADRARLGDRAVTTTFLQSLPGMRNRFWYYLGLMPYAVESMDLRDHDVVVSSSHAFAKGVLTNADQLHLSYVHSPMRYAWDLHHEYMDDYGLRSGPKAWFARWLFHRLRLWDMRTANGVDLFLANSRHVARRIWKTYRRPSRVLYPPVDVSRFNVAHDKEDYYLVVSRLVSYKKVGLIVDAFAALPDKRLVVIGDGPEMAKVGAGATPNVQLLGRQSDAVVADYMRKARAFVFAAKEDFGITPVEAQACGTPVIAYGAGGALETVRGLDVADAAATGVFFASQSVESIRAAIAHFENNRARITADACRANAESFSRERFQREFASIVDAAVGCWRKGDDPEAALADAPAPWVSRSGTRQVQP